MCKTQFSCPSLKALQSYVPLNFVIFMHNDTHKVTSLCSELLPHFLSNRLETWNISSPCSVDVQDTIFMSVVPGITELCALELSHFMHNGIHNITSLCSELLQHFLSDWLETWNISSLCSVDVQDTIFMSVCPGVTELCALEHQKKKDLQSKWCCGGIHHL